MVWFGFDQKKTQFLEYQCLGFVGSARFRLPGSCFGSAKKGGSMNPDQGGKNINQILPKKNLLSKLKSELLEIRDCNYFLISEWFTKLKLKNKRKNRTNNLKIQLLKKN